MSLKSAKAKAWKLFSEYIRRRGADHNSYQQCVTCKKQVPWSELHAGHFIDGRNNSVLFDERLVWPQCVTCNVFRHGNKIEYFKFMRTKYSEKKIFEFENLKHAVKKMREADYKELQEKYKLKIMALKGIYASHERL